MFILIALIIITTTLSIIIVATIYEIDKITNKTYIKHCGVALRYCGGIIS